MKALSRIPCLKISFQHLQTQDLELAAALTGLQRCFPQIPLSGTELLLIVKACDSWRHPHQMDSGFHSMQKCKCTWLLPTVGNNLLQKFAETQKEVKCQHATEQMQHIRHLPKAVDMSPGTTGQCKKLSSPWNPGHQQHTLTDTSLAGKAGIFQHQKELT